MVCRYCGENHNQDVCQDGPIALLIEQEREDLARQDQMEYESENCPRDCDCESCSYELDCLVFGLIVGDLCES